MPIEHNILKTSGVLQLKGGTADAMTAANPMLARREIAVEIDSGKIKVGDGSHYWNDLPYTSGNSLAFPASDDNVYVVKNGSFVQATIINPPNEWTPVINDNDVIFLTVDQDMNPYQLSGSNTEVSSS